MSTTSAVRHWHKSIGERNRGKRLAAAKKNWLDRLEVIKPLNELPDAKRISIADRLANKELANDQAIVRYAIAGANFVLFGFIVWYSESISENYRILNEGYIQWAAWCVLYAPTMVFVYFTARWKADLAVCECLIQALEVASKDEAQWHTMRFKRKLISRIERAANALQSYLVPLTPRRGPPRRDLSLAAYRRATRIRRMENWVAMPVSTTVQDVRTQLLHTLELVIDDNFAALPEEQATPPVRRANVKLAVIVIAATATVTLAILILVFPESFGGADVKAIVALVAPMIVLVLSVFARNAASVASANEVKTALEDVTDASRVVT